MKKNDYSYQHNFKKINENINLKVKPIFDEKEPNIIYYASNNMIISYDIKTSFIVERLRISNSKIRSFSIRENNIFALDNDGEFTKFCLREKQVTKFLKLSKILKGKITQNENSSENILTYFKFSKYLNSFLLINEDLKMLKINFELDDEVIIEDLYDNLENNFKENFSKMKNKVIKFFDIDTQGKFITFSMNNKLFCVNLFGNNVNVINFMKPISTGIFLEDTKIVVGDNAGKIHFITNYMEENVKKFFKFF